MNATLSEVEARLAGSGRRVTVTGNRIRSNWCPVCGGKQQRYRKVFVVTETADALLAHCHRCLASHQEISQALGIRLGPFWRNEIPDGIEPDPGPFRADDEVIARVRRGQMEVTTDYGSDEIGWLANQYVWHNLHARRRTTRLAYPAEEMPTSRRYIVRLLRRIGIRIGTTKAQKVSHRIRSLNETTFHYYPRHVAQRRNRRGIAIALTHKLRSHSGFTTTPTCSDHSVRSWSSRPSVKGAENLVEVLVEQVQAVAHSHSPPWRFVVPEEVERSDEIPAAAWLDTASFLAECR